MQRRGRDARRRGHAVPHGLPGAAARAARRHRCSRTCGPSPAAARRSRRSCTTTSKEEIGGVGIVSGYGLTEARSSRWRAVPTRRAARRHRGQADARRRAQGRDARRRRSRRRARRARSGSRRPQLFKRLPRLARSTPTPSTRTAASAPATSASSTTTATSSITGRLKDVIIRKGENISAKEVEDLLFTHPKVGDVAVIGLPDPSRGERACAVVVPARRRRPADARRRWSSSCTGKPGS